MLKKGIGARSHEITPATQAILVGMEMVSLVLLPCNVFQMELEFLTLNMLILVWPIC